MDKIETNWKDLKVVFFDFDRTLCVHEYISHGGYDVYDYYLTELSNQASVHEKDKPLPCMQRLVENVKKNGARLVCLSHTITNLRDDYNKNFLRRYYGEGFEYITVSSPEQKIEMMKAYCKAHGISYYKSAFVEDRMGALELAAALGFVCFHVSDVALWYELNEKAAVDLLCDIL